MDSTYAQCENSIGSDNIWFGNQSGFQIAANGAESLLEDFITGGAKLDRVNDGSRHRQIQSIVNSNLVVAWREPFNGDGSADAKFDVILGGMSGATYNFDIPIELDAIGRVWGDSHLFNREGYA